MPRACAPYSAGRYRRRCFGGIDRHVSSDLLQTLGDHAPSLSQAIGHDVDDVALCADRDALHLQLALRVDLKQAQPT